MSDQVSAVTLNIRGEQSIDFRYEFRIHMENNEYFLNSYTSFRAALQLKVTLLDFDPSLASESWA